MKNLVVILVLGLTGVAIADQMPVPTQPPSAGAVAQPPPDANREACVAAMNNDPAFAKSIVATVDKQIDAKTIAAHEQAAQQIAENEKHVLLSYAAMWLIAAGFVVFLWRRQQVLKNEIEQLRKDLEAAGKS